MSVSEKSPVSENIVLLSESLSENMPLSANSSLSENASLSENRPLSANSPLSENASLSENAPLSANSPLSENASLSETVFSSPPAHFESPLERQLQQEYFGSPSANSSVLSDNNDLLDTDISEEKKMKSKSCNESSTDPANDLPFNEISKNKILDTRRLIETVSSFSESGVLKDMPRCKNENVYFLLDNTENIERKARGNNMEF